MKTSICTAILLALCAAGGTAGAAPPPCAADAVVQARKLLIFHRGPDDRIEVDRDAKELAPLRNPANKKQQFTVLEVLGSIYKGQYRMWLIYFVSGNDCTLMGQEILEHAGL